MNCMTDLKGLIGQGFTNWEQFGNVRAVYQNGLILFNYTQAAQFEGRWNWFEQVSRGLIVDTKTAEVVARPFDKFWNWGEGGRYSVGQIVSATEKMDGSLGILYRLPNEQYAIATRGSFDSEQALWATTELAIAHDLYRPPLGQEWTLLFEIVYPDNRVVVDYEGLEALFLLAARNRYTGEYLPLSDVRRMADVYGFPTPELYDFEEMTDILHAAKALDGNSEGWVIEFDDGQRFKVKGDRYVEIHRIITATSFRRIVETIAAGTFEETIAAVPDELLGQINDWRQEIEAKVAAITAEVEAGFALAPKAERKTFALWVNEHQPDLAPYLFQRLDGRDYRPLIYKREF